MNERKLFKFLDRHPWVAAPVVLLPAALMIGQQFLSDNTRIIIGLLLFCLLMIGLLLWLLLVVCGGARS